MQGAPTAAPGARCSFTSLVGHSRSLGVELERFVCQAQAVADGRCRHHRLCATEGCGGTIELHHEYGEDLCSACHDRLDEERYPPVPFHEPSPRPAVLCLHGFSDRICYDCRSDEYERRNPKEYR